MIQRKAETEKEGGIQRKWGDRGKDKGEVRQRQRGTETHKKGSLDREKEELRQ